MRRALRLHPAVLTFHEMVRYGIPRDRLVFVLCKIGTEAEEAEARTYIAQAGFDALAGSIPERPAYRQAQNIGLTITETRFPQLNRRADVIWNKGTNRAQFLTGEVNRYTWVDVGSSFLPSELCAAFLYPQFEARQQIQSARGLGDCPNLKRIVVRIPIPH